MYPPGSPGLVTGNSVSGSCCCPPLSSCRPSFPGTGTPKPGGSLLALGGPVLEGLGDVSIMTQGALLAIPTELGLVQTLQSANFGFSSLTGAMPAEVCAVAADPLLVLDTLIVDCLLPEVVCEVPTCCSACAE